jgi:hypothetical protein
LICKNRSRNPEVRNYGCFHIVDENNCIVAGGGSSGFDMTLDEVAAWVDGP